MAIGEALGEGRRRFFEELGVGPAKPIEACVDDAAGGVDGMLLYGAWYRLVGGIERRFELPSGTAEREWLDAMTHDIGGASASFKERVIGEGASFGGTDVIQIELLAGVPWRCPRHVRAYLLRRLRKDAGGDADHRPLPRGAALLESH